MRCRSERGFTLIEMMVVIVVIGIIAAIAYPAYTDQLRKTRRSDGQARLVEVAQRLERCRSRLGVYNDAVNCPMVNNVFNGGTLPSEENWYVISATALTPTTFNLQAVPQGAQATDVRCATFLLDQAGTEGSTGTLPAIDCW